MIETVPTFHRTWFPMGSCIALYLQARRQRQAADLLLARAIAVPAFARGPALREHALQRSLLADENLLRRGAWLTVWGEA